MKKSLALMLSLILLLTMFPITTFATSVDPSKQATIEYVLMKYKAGQSDSGAANENQRCEETTIPADGFKAGDELLVGLKVVGLNNLDAASHGFYSIMAGIRYNNTILEPKANSGTNMLKRIGTGEGTLFVEDPDEGEALYSFQSGDMGDNPDDTDANYNIATVSIAYGKTNKPQFKGENPFYIGIFKFNVKEDATIPESGITAFTVPTDSLSYSCSFGTNGMDAAYVGGDLDNNMVDYFVTDTSKIDIFPKKASPLGGTATITGTTTYGETLEVDVTQVTGATNFKYQWTDGTNNIAGATNKTFKVDKPALAGKTLTCIVSAADPAEASGSVTATAATAIGKKELTVSGTTVANKTFDNKTAAVASGTTLSGKVNTGDKVDVAVKANFENATTGTGKNVKVDYTLSGTDAGAYTLDKTTETLTADITKAQLTVTAANQTVKVGADVTLSGKVTGAVTGADPGMSYTYAVKDGSTDVITVSGDKAHGVAAGSKLVTVTGTITDTTNYEFAAGKGTADATVTVSDKVATGITIKTQPTKLAYEAGETLDLTGLTVNVTYDDNTNEDVTFADFADKGISASPVDGTVLAVSDNGKPVTVTVGSKSATTDNLTVVAAATRVTLKTKGAATKAYDNSTAFGKAVWTTGPEFKSNNGEVDTSKAVYTFADKNAGEWEITVTGLTVNGAPASISGSVADGTITKADPELVIGNLAQRVGNVTALTAETVPADDKAIADKFTYEIDIKTTDGGINFVDWDDANVNGLQAGSYNVVVNYAGSENTNATTEAAILVLSKRSSGGGSSSVREYTVRFAAGEHGTIDGKTSVSVEKDAKLKSSDVPTVKADEGYKFIGWSLDGKTVVDPTKEAVTGSLSYTALYQQYNAHKTYMSGYSDGTFRPDGRTTRAEVASLMAGLIEGFDKDAAYNSTLNDIEDAAWYAQAVKFMSQKGLISGYDDGSYRPNNQITRQEFCAIIAKYMGLNGEGTANFNDVAEAWGKGYIGQLAAKGIVNGYPDGSFQPDKAITRAEVVTILNKVFDRTPDAELVDENIGNYTVRLSDVSKNHWAYTQILEAAIEHETADFHK